MSESNGVIGIATNAEAREAAEQLIHLTRLAMYLEDLYGARIDSREQAANRPEFRILRHSGVKLTRREQAAFHLLVRGNYNALIAQSMGVPAGAVESHIQDLRVAFAAPPAPVRPAPGTRQVQRKAARGGRTRTVLAGATVVSVVTAGAVLLAHDRVEDASAHRWPPSDPMNPLAAYGVTGGRPAMYRSAWSRSRPALPRGVATATSFWDPATAGGKPMSYRTLASPYWPLGTRAKISHKGESAIGVVEDFGPAEWAIAQHPIPAIVDVSEKMMADLTGVPVNAVRVKFQVLEWGTGETYRDSGTGYELAMGR